MLRESFQDTELGRDLIAGYFPLESDLGKARVRALLNRKLEELGLPSIAISGNSFDLN